MTQYEYDIINVNTIIKDDKKMKRLLTEWGLAGWLVTGILAPGNGQVNVYFAREVPSLTETERPSKGPEEAQSGHLD